MSLAELIFRIYGLILIIYFRTVTCFQKELRLAALLILLGLNGCIHVRPLCVFAFLMLFIFLLSFARLIVVSVSGLLLAGVLIVLLAELNFRYVEEPLRRVGSERAKRQLMQLEGGGGKN